MVSAASQERRHYELYFGKSDHVSLYGDFGDPDCRTGVDLMTTALGGPYDYIISLGVMDYIPRPDAALKNVRNALRPGGTYIFYIMPYRLVDMKEAVKVTNYNGLRRATYMNFSDGETGVPNCRFSPDAIPCWSTAVGLLPGKFEVEDYFSGVVHTYFTAQRRD